MKNECGLEAQQRSSERTLQEGLQENILIFGEEKYDNDLSKGIRRLHLQRYDDIDDNRKRTASALH